MNVSDFDFDLPPEAIAQRPAPRGTSRLMRLDRRSGAVSHWGFRELPELLLPGDLLVLNDTAVIPARLFGRDAAGRRVELLLASRVAAPTAPGPVWDCLAKPGRRARPGSVFDLGEGVTARVLEKPAEGRYRVSFEGDDAERTLGRLGSAPLPPYIHRPDGVADEQDRVDYQTVFAREEGAIAAPTAGLHFTREVLAALGARGIQVAYVTLHVGLGTFKPVKVERVEEHVMDSESGRIPDETAALVNAAKQEGRRVVACGTTSARTLEASARANGGLVSPGPFSTSLFLTPGAEFLVLDALLTNFHLPRSTLMMLVSAFAGREHVLAAYREAVSSGYRFFSFGDAMLIA